MAKFRDYAPEQAWLIPPSIEDVLGCEHLCFFIHAVVERLDLRAIEASYGEEGHPGYHPKLLVKLWLYAYCLGVTSSRRLEQRTREDLGFRYLAAGAQPDHWTLNAFRKRHPRSLNDCFTQVVEFARQQGCARLGHVAIDSTRIAANASPDSVRSAQSLRQERASLRRQIRAWQKHCQQQAQQEGAGTDLDPRLRQRLEQIPAQLERLRKSGLPKQSGTDPESRFLRQRGGFVLGYTAEIAVTEDHWIVAQRVTQQASDHGSFTAVLEELEQRYHCLPIQASADSGYYTSAQIAQASACGVECYVPDNHLARELHGGPRAEQAAGCIQQPRHVLAQMRRKLRSAAGRAVYQKRKCMVEPVFGVLKEQRHGRRFRLRGLAQVAIEFCWMTLAFNVTRMFQQRLRLA